MTVYDGPPGKPALTHVRTLAFDGKLSASLVRIETGRLAISNLHTYKSLPFVSTHTHIQSSLILVMKVRSNFQDITLLNIT
jgi:hypothetical protein